MKRAAVTAATLVAVVASTAGSAAAATSVTGRLEIRHADNFARRSASTSYTLRTGHRHHRLRVVPSAPPRILSGSEVRVSGRRVGHRLEGSVRQLSSRLHSATIPAGPRKVAVILINFTGDTRQPWTPDYVRQRVFTASDSTNAFYQEESHGDISLIGSTRSDGDVYGWYTIPEDPSVCDSDPSAVDRWASDAQSAAAADGFDAANYQHVVYVFPQESGCDWAGLGEVPGTQAWINGDISVRVVAHELGHNMGLHHASSYSCSSGGTPVTIGGTCTPSEYGDPFDVMGVHPKHQNGWHLAQLGLVGGASVQTVNASGTYTVTSSANPTSAVQLLRIPRGRLPGYPWSEYYDLELRTSIGVFDNYPSTDPVVNGVLIHVDPSTSVVTQSLLLDTTPGSTGGFQDAALAAGRTFSDGNISITTNSIAGDTASVSVVFGAAGGSPPPPVTPPPPIAPPPPPVDRVPPAVRISAPTSRRVRRNVAVRANARDNVGVRQMQLVVDSVPRRPVTGARLNTTLRNLRRGRHTLEVLAFDAGGNAGRRVVSVRVTR